MALSSHARKRQRAANLVSERYPGLNSLQRNVFAELVARTAEGWQLAVRTGSASAADAYLIGRVGVFAIVVADPAPDTGTMQAVLRQVDELFAALSLPGDRRIAASAVTPVVIGAPDSPAGPRNAGPFWSLPASRLDLLFRRDTVHLTTKQVARIAGELRPRLDGYDWPSIEASAAEEEPIELLSAESVAENQLAAAVERPFDTWMTFLHPDQAALATRNYGGPARISGPAGTGKTVVALHRLRHAGRRSTGPLLFTAFVRNLPPVSETAFRRLAPEMADRAEFVSLHSWASAFLASREIHLNIAFETAFSLAWRTHSSALQDAGPQYWADEVHRVIKGRGIKTLAEYQRVIRRGRRRRLDNRQRATVWQVYLDYQKNLAERNAHDFDDLLARALRELERQPLEEPYAAVVVDEVQDMTLTGLRLLRMIAGDGPNQLLLVGDGQQQVYPGGWRLSDAGIPVQGRGEVLKVNYRNRVGILDFARRITALNEVDDLDGAAGVALRDAAAVNDGGIAKSWEGTESELPNALVAAVRGLDIPLGETALITFSNRDALLCRKLLDSAGVATQPIDQHTGETGDRLYAGTVHKAKGLDFRAVLVVDFVRPEPEDPATEQEKRELRNRQRLVAATRARDFLWWATVKS
ncbi:UvrD-helicase domain-containing protein [Amycolatopsis circi]|uniref:UvrD-helicase domain-containing protein n=1 Tax=Amycolatopsis circi TaxID=871959 RepID=UPI000E267653|nr:UvrD-helicase domain-containing protein [Amycolatopsis circi]